jgi:hypothetical protein
MDGTPTFLDDLVALAHAVVRSERVAARIEPAPQGDIAAVAVQPVRVSACPVELWVDPKLEQVGMILGEEATPYDRLFPELVTPDVWAAAREHLRELLTAVVRGGYRQERFFTGEGTLVLTRGVFELPRGEHEHVVRHSLSLFRRRRREDLSFGHY